MKYTVLALFLPLVEGNANVEHGSTTNKWKPSLSPSQAHEKLGILRERADNSTNWNDARANSIGINEDLGWNYDFCRIEFPRSKWVELCVLDTVI